jgi:hypothetical protein
MANQVDRVQPDEKELAERAARRPVTFVAPAVVLVVGAFAGLLIPAIVVAIIAFVISIGVQVDSAKKKAAGGAPSRPRRAPTPQYAPEIQSELDKAHATQRAIEQAIAAADHPFEEIQEDVRMIVSAMETSAKRAQMIYDTLHDQTQAGHDERAIQAQIERLKPRFKEKEVRELINDLEAQRQSHVGLRESLERFKINMARLNASLGLMRNRLVEMSAAEEATIQRELTAQARDIRDRTERFTRVLLESSEEAGGDDLQRELDRDAAGKRAQGAPSTIPLRNRAEPPPAPKPKPAAPMDTGPRQIPLRNRAAPPAKPAPKRDEGPRTIPLSNRAAPPAKPEPKRDEGPRTIPMRNRAKPAAPDEPPQNPRIDTRHPGRD